MLQRVRKKMCCTNALLTAFGIVLLANTGMLIGLYFRTGTEGLEDIAPNLAVLDELVGYMNSAHYPLPYEEFSRPDQGGCCNALCSGDTCFVGTAYTFDSRSCNLCCFHLVEPASCDGNECACYANSQE